MNPSKFPISRIVASLTIGAATLLGPNVAQSAEQYPDRAIRLIVPFSPGGQTDSVSRRLGLALTALVGQQIVIDNRTGASGTIGSGEAARAKPDGYTMVMATASTHAINPTLMVNIPYDAVKDFAPVRALGTGPMSISVHPSVPARNLKQLIADIKARPAFFSYGTAGVGSVNHLGGELFKSVAGLQKLPFVPYRGAGPAVQDLVGGQIPMVCTSLNSALPFHRTGRIHTLAVLKEERSAGAPEIPTAAEAGVAGAVAYTFNIVLVPTGTPRSIIDYLNNALGKVMADNNFADTLIKIGVDPITKSSPEHAAEMIKSEIAKWKPLIEKLNLRR